MSKKQYPPKRRSPLVEIACAGCGRTQRVQEHKVVPADGYCCGGMGGCKLNPDFHPPRPPEGCVCVWESCAAGSFDGWTIRPAMVEERASIARARAIYAAAFGRWP